ncbi:ABC transporter ATP-binding protein [Cohnella xylanilytica]|uniref:ABC transporter ATP-binding protein n=1 Tax=Cohnella xylanilytica TaxID=557555 RepID=UPI001BB42099
MRQETVLEATGLSKRYTHKGRTEPVLNDVSFQVGQNEIISILGKSGCGKSTLLHLLGGFERPDEGTVRINGQPVTGPSRNCIMLFQHYGLLPWRTVLGNVELGLENERLPASERKERAMRYLRKVGLEDKAGAFPRQLSGGMQQRVALARALAVQPKLLLMDEPFAAVDTFTRYQLQDELLRIQREERTTIILVTHDIDEAVYLSDRVLLMGANPGTIRTELAVPAAKPRDRGHEDFLHVRRTVLERFELTRAAPAPEFSI